MNIADIKQMIDSSAYEFLKHDYRLENKIILLTVGGSYAYGTNTETSDIDIRGIALNSTSDILGLSNFEQLNHDETDTVIYSVNKIFQLLIGCNPNVIEMLGNRPDAYFMLTPEGSLILDNKNLFLSKRAIKTFGGYAYAQLSRLLNALGRNSNSALSIQENLLRSLESSMLSFNTRFHNFKYGDIVYYIDNDSNQRDGYDLYCDVQLKHYPVKEFNGIINDTHNILKSYNKLNHRNTKKDNSHLCKHAMHLIRLYMMGCDILENQCISTYREGPEHDLLMTIRNGNYLSDGKFTNEFFEIVKSFQDKFEYASKHTCLPDNPNICKIQDLLMSINLVSISK